MLRYLTLGVAGLGLAASALAGTQTFTFKSDNPSGTGEHMGTVTLTSTSETNIYDVVWTIPEGSLKGIAFVDEGSDTAYVSYGLEANPGLVVLREGKERDWVGKWYQAGRSGNEVWTVAK